MSRWKLSLLLLLTLAFYTETKDDQHLLVRGGGSEVIPVCSGETPVVFVKCRIGPDKKQGDECQLFYKHSRGFESNCSSRFTLKTQNQTLFLHLSNLTPEDSGDYTCECSLAAGMHSEYLNITVIDDGYDAPVTHGSDRPVLNVVIAVVTVAAAFLGLIIWIRKRNREKSESAIHGSPVCNAPASLAPDQTYSNLGRPVCQIYQNLSESAAKPDRQEANVHMRCMIYENV